MIEILVWLLIFTLTFAVVTTALSIRKQRRIDRKREEQTLKRNVWLEGETRSIGNPAPTRQEAKPPKPKRGKAVDDLKREIGEDKIIHPPEKIEGLKTEIKLDKNGWVVAEKKPKSIDDRVRELARKKQGRKPFYKNDKKKEWE